ncbi:MAG: 5-dehydro-2-deoxygluconokinase [Lactobacillus sp.]|uniref:5-dehydro-2-deoxygluconokinase n=1 Tax=Bombilactobacillus bombi TaxID=1303590 RepID=UPI0035E77372|nr:5-dehydro-2-deoxygluconokinase [Lactobacillus sp.]
MHNKSILTKDIITFPTNRKFDMTLLGRVAIDFNPVDYFQTLAESTTFKKYVGGSPANTAVGLSRLGKNVGFISAVSKDRFGEYVTKYFENEGIDTSHIMTCQHGEKLGLTFTEILSKDESSILMYRNQIADLALEPSVVDEEYIQNSKSLLISGTALAQSPSRDAVLKAVSLAKKNHTPIIFDIDYRSYNWTNTDEIAVYYSLVAREAYIIMGSREEFDLTEKLLGLDSNDKTSADYWFKQNAKIIVIKHGKEGSTAYLNNGEDYSIKPFPIEALKSFGGGDGYAAGFLNGVLNGWDIIECLEMGSAEAAILVASHGCSDFMPHESEVRTFIKDEKAKYGDMVARV